MKILQPILLLMLCFSFGIDSADTGSNTLTCEAKFVNKQNSEAFKDNDRFVVFLDGLSFVGEEFTKWRWSFGAGISSNKLSHIFISIPVSVGLDIYSNQRESNINHEVIEGNESNDRWDKKILTCNTISNFYQDITCNLPSIL